MKPKVLALMGSPRRGGNSDLLLDSLIEGARESGAEVEKIWIRRLKFQPCLEINYCQKTGECILKDDMTAIYPKLLEAEIVVLASPVFFMGVSADAKALIDRCQSFWARKYMLKKPVPLPPTGRPRRGIFISTAGHKNPVVFNGSRATTKTFFDTVDAEYSRELLYGGMDDKEDIKDHPSALTDAYEVGRSLFDLDGPAPAD